MTFWTLWIIISIMIINMYLSTHHPLRHRSILTPHYFLVLLFLAADFSYWKLFMDINISWKSKQNSQSCIIHKIYCIYKCIYFSIRRRHKNFTRKKIIMLYCILLSSITCRYLSLFLLSRSIFPSKNRWMAQF